MERIEIKRIGKSIIGELLKVHAQSIQEDFPEYSKRVKEYFLKDTYKKNLVKYVTIAFGAYINKKLVGYLFAEKPHGGVCFCQWLGVLKGYQKKGLGKALLLALEEIVKEQGAHSIRLEVSKYNIPFYEKMGFEVIGFDKQGYFGTNNYLMKKKIGEVNEEKFLK